MKYSNIFSALSLIAVFATFSPAAANGMYDIEVNCELAGNCTEACLISLKSSIAGQCNITHDNGRLTLGGCKPEFLKKILETIPSCGLCEVACGSAGPYGTY